MPRMAFCLLLSERGERPFLAHSGRSRLPDVCLENNWDIEDGCSL